jgi:16S rRNA (guanine527-N7)-methyltransferase
VSGHEISAFVQYLGLLTKWQRVQRLVGSVDPKWLIENVILDSLLFLRALPAGVKSIADLGSGAGLPGIPIKIVNPEIKVTLIESRERRASFLSAAVRELGLLDCRVVVGRAESVEQTDRGYDAVVMRCAGDLVELIPVAAALTRPGGVVIASGPPAARGSGSGGVQFEWVEVDGVTGARLFAVYRKP